MKKVVYSVSRFNKFGNNKLTGIGFITEKDLIIACDTVFKVQTVFIGEQVIIRNADLAALGNGDRDFVFFYGYDVKNDGIFSVKELEFFQIKFVHEMPP